MLLTLDHLIIRSATPEETLLQLAERTGAPVLAEVEDVRGMASGIVRAGTVDIEVLRLGDESPERPHGYGLGFVADRPLGEALAGAMTRIPALARAATRHAGRSMVVVTEYGFDVDAVRAEAGTGPSVVEVHLGTGDRGGAWGRLPLDGGPQVHLDDAGPAGIRRIVLAGAAGASFALGNVEFELAGA